MIEKDYTMKRDELKSELAALNNQTEVTDNLSSERSEQNFEHTANFTLGVKAHL